MIEAPFVFGRYAEAIEFTNREQDTRHLITNFNSRINTILISPRRWGKSSLVMKAARTAQQQNKNLKFCFIDLFNARSEEDFYKQLSEGLIKATATKWEERAVLARNLFKNIVPKLNIGIDDHNEFSLGIDWNDIKKSKDEILNLPERLCIEKKIKLVVCIDEFQNIAFNDNPLAFQKKLRSHWQKHQLVSYCLYGSKKHMLTEVFSSPSMPFYKFGDIIFMQKIKAEHWEKFIVKRFRDTGKEIKPEAAKQIASLCNNHSYYVQQLAQLTWLRTQKKANVYEVEQAYQALLNQLSLLFQTITEGLSNSQVSYLNAVIDGVQKFSSKEVIDKYELGSSANVNRVRNALMGKEIIDILDNKVELLDPMYEHWLKLQYFIS